MVLTISNFFNNYDKIKNNYERCNVKMKQSKPGGQGITNKDRLSVKL